MLSKPQQARLDAKLHNWVTSLCSQSHKGWRCASDCVKGVKTKYRNMQQQVLADTAEEFLSETQRAVEENLSGKWRVLLG